MQLHAIRNIHSYISDNGNFPLPLMNRLRIRNAKTPTHIRYSGVNKVQMLGAIKVVVRVRLKPIILKMSCAAAHRVRLFWPSHIAYLLLTLILSLSVILQQVSASPLPDLTQEYQNLLAEAFTDNSTDSTTDNSTIAANTDV